MNVSLKNTWRRVAAIACTLAVSASLLQAATASPASADDKCTVGVICSATTNLSVFRVRVSKSWCPKDGAPCPGSDEMWLYPGQSTPLLEDWDAFRIDSGWCYSYFLTPPNIPYRKYGHKWVRIHNGQRADILGQARVPSWLCV
ncbi:hypothetical protein FKR81_30275 [Lentzea tibetensis]|uniref:Secreted protein n=1 Tax=Lentzea tibetensis TaxID=2591470 RepID=A0A563ELC5_9PSEU|nr:hypothetical protein [Lentzea tibetensis]TWP47958.1 hypothetical protein FKR81_30275 [Lentzea tibetensis]